MHVHVATLGMKIEPEPSCCALSARAARAVLHRNISATNVQLASTLQAENDEIFPSRTANLARELEMGLPVNVSLGASS